MNKETKELIYNPPSIKNLQPHYFRNTSPIEDITASEDEELSRLSLELMRIYRNNYLNTADESTLGIYEFLYGVTPPYQNKDIYVFLDRNLLKNSGQKITNDSYAIAQYPLTEPLVLGEWYTIQIKGQLGVGKTRWAIYNSGASVYETEVSPEHLKDGVYSLSWQAFEQSRNNTYIRVYAYPSSTVVNSTIEWIKLTKGKTALPWTPAPEELPEGAEIQYLPADSEVVKLSGSQMISKFISQTVEDNKLYLVENRDIDALVESVNKSAVVDGFVVRVYGTDYITYLPDINIHGERRARLANRESTKPPFTKRFLVNKLDELLGEGNYTLMIDYPNSTIQIESTNPSQSWAEEVYITINNIKPASMVYLNIPVDSNEVIVEEGVNLSQYLYNYRLGTQWVLGRKAFTSFEDLGEVKNMAINSFTPLAHTKAADFLVTQVAKVRLNGDDDKMITTFISKNTVGGMGELVYEVPSGFVTAVNKVDLMDSTNGILSTSNFYVPIPGTTQIKHRFRVRNVS